MRTLRHVDMAMLRGGGGHSQSPQSGSNFKPTGLAFQIMNRHRRQEPYALVAAIVGKRRPFQVIARLHRPDLVQRSRRRTTETRKEGTSFAVQEYRLHCSVRSGPSARIIARIQMLLVRFYKRLVISTPYDQQNRFEVVATFSSFYAPAVRADGGDDSSFLNVVE